LIIYKHIDKMVPFV